MPESTWPRYDLVSHRAETTPDRTALVDAADGTTTTFGALDAEVGALAARLDELGVSLGTRVGVCLPTRPAVVRLTHAVARLGGVVVGLNVRKQPDQLRDQAKRAEVDLLVCGASTADIGRALAESIEQVVSVDGDAGLPTLPKTARDPPVPLARDPDSLALVLFSSGTTGDPKGVRLTRRNLLESAEASAYRLGISPGDRWLCCLPTYHMGGFAPIVRTALYGTTLVVQRGFDAESTAAVLGGQSVTGVSLVPTMLERLLDAGWHPPDALETVLLGGAPATEALLERALDRGVPVHPTYGMSETASQIATATPEQARAYPGTVGQPLVNTTVRVVGEDGPCPRGDPGELVVDGPTVTPGYLDDERTSAAIGEYGFHTGDLGYRDAEGRLWVLGRVDERITTGGESVDPEVVAGAIRDHPDVDEAAVVGLPDPEWGQRVAALVAGNVDSKAVEAHCRKRLADFEVPKTVVVADSLPRTASGTVDREAVRERLRANT